jgi:hypothetical protein
LEQPNYASRALIGAFSDSTVAKMKDKQTLIIPVKPGAAQKIINQSFPAFKIKIG